MKKILHIISQYPGKTGSGVFLQSLVNEAGKLGYSQAVVAGVSKKIEKVVLKKEYNIDFYPVEFNTEKMNFNIVGMSDIMPYESTKYSDLNEEMYSIWENSFKKVIENAVNEFNPEIIVSSHLFLMTSIVSELIRKKNIKLIVLSQGTELRQLSLNPRFKNKVLKGCKHVDMVCALNDYQKDEINKIYEIEQEKIKVMGVGYNSDIFYSSKNIKKKRQIVFAGKLSSSKGLKCLISAVKKIDDEIKLLIAGSGEEEKEMKLLSKGNSRIEFLGSISQESLASVLRESEAFILPSFYEGLPLVIMEALACNAKVIMSDIKGIKSWVGEDINKSGGINYISLPRLKNVDVPFEEDLEGYEESIKESIINIVDKKVDFSKIEKEVLNRSWNVYFQNLLKNIDEL